MLGVTRTIRVTFHALDIAKAPQMHSTAELTHSSSSPLGSFGLTPGGVVVCHDPESRLSAIFADSEPAGMITLGGHPADSAADATCLFWKSVADQLIHHLCQIPDGSETLPDLPVPEPVTLAEWTLNAPPHARCGISIA